MSSRAYILGFVVLVAATSKLTALFVMPETRLVPIDRLVKNLERQVEADPRRVETLINLGRLHAMAFALKVEEFVALRGPSEAQDTPYYSPDLGPVPPKVRPAPSPDQAASAERHLKDAIRHYEAAVALAPNHPIAHLGLGWVLQQSDNIPRAVAEYRQVVALAWVKEEKIRTLMPGQSYLTQEAIAYLLPLLHPERDAAEITDLRSKQQSLTSRGRAITPIAIPLADAVPADDILDPAARVRFDADGSGFRREWTWISGRAGWLVYDAEGRGEIRSALQLFGNVTFWLFWTNGYEALRSLDDNGDDELRGVELDKLGLWQDRNRNGISDAGEVRPLSDHGIVALACAHTVVDDSRFAAVSIRGATLRDGRERPTYDVILRHSVLTLTGVPFHQRTNRSLASEQSSMKNEKQTSAINASENDRLLWRSREISP
jgi:tetratricopeptide (TPR) repeat protein